MGKTPTWAVDAQIDGETTAKELTAIIEKAIRNGDLTKGTRLPTQRTLADQLNINVGTIARAYRQLKDSGLINARRRHGSFINDIKSVDGQSSDGNRAVNLRTFTATPDIFIQLFQGALADLGKDVGKLREISGYRTHEMLGDERAVIADWLGNGDVSIDPASLLFAENGTNAISTALIAFCKPGDTIVAESLTLPGLIVAARVFGLNLVGAPMDEHGVVPDALDAICATHKPKLLLCMPVAQNPTCVAMPEARRRAVVNVLKRHEVLLVEDDLYFDLVPKAERVPRMATFYPDRTVVIGSPSKTLAQILRSGYVIAPDGLRQFMADSLTAQSLFPPALTTHLWSRMIESGAAAEQIAYLRTQLALRADSLKHHLPKSITSGVVPFGWIPLPPTASATEFGMRALLAGVAMRNSDEFAVPGTPSAPGLRVNLMGSPAFDDYERGLKIITDIVGTTGYMADIQP
jgi:DNA-binding transcriptional MocR family regulator